MERDDPADKKEGIPKTPKRFLNGWTKEQEHLMSEWSDIAMCYRWLHDQSEKRFHKKTMYINLPVIILSTLGGTANFGIQSLFEDDTIKKYASFGIGGISLLAGLMTTIGNYLRYPQMEEAHRVSSVSWGKLQRLIAIELALHPNDRLDSLDFLKICRAELDRLIEQSPPIPQEVIYKFEERFGAVPDLKKPDVCGALEHTTVFESSEERLKQLSVETALAIKRKKEMIAELIAPEVQENLRQHVAIQIQEALELEKEKIRKEMEEEEEKTAEMERQVEERRKKIQAELEQWSGTRSQRSGSITAMESRLRHSTGEISHMPNAQRTAADGLPNAQRTANDSLLKATDGLPNAQRTANDSLLKATDGLPNAQRTANDSLPKATDSLPKAIPKASPPSSPLPQNTVVNPLFDRASLLTSQRSPQRPPHPKTAPIKGKQ